MFIYSIIDKITLIKHSKGIRLIAQMLLQVGVPNNDIRYSVPICVTLTFLDLIGNYIGSLLMSVISRRVRQAVTRLSRLSRRGRPTASRTPQ